MVVWRVLKWFRNRFAKCFFSSSHINFDKVYHIKLTKKSSSTFAFQDFCQSSSTWWNTKKLSTLATTQYSKGLPEFQLLTKKIKNLTDYKCETVNSRLIQKSQLVFLQLSGFNHFTYFSLSYHCFYLIDHAPEHFS